MSERGRSHSGQGKLGRSPEFLQSLEREPLAAQLTAHIPVAELLDVLGLVRGQLHQPLAPVTLDETGEPVARSGLVRRLELIVHRAELPALVAPAETQRHEKPRPAWSVADLRHPVVRGAAQAAL